jgi:hypothetical protein
MKQTMLTLMPLAALALLAGCAQQPRPSVYDIGQHWGECYFDSEIKIWPDEQHSASSLAMDIQHECAGFLKTYVYALIANGYSANAAGDAFNLEREFTHSTEQFLLEREIQALRYAVKQKDQ